MNDADDEFLRSIPPFLRRYHEPPLRKLPIRPRDLPAARSQAEPRPQPAAAPTAATPTAAAPATPAVAKVVEIAQPAAAKDSVAQRARIALAFENQDVAQGTAQGMNGDDIAFQVTLPRDVARQICMLAVERDTTQRAVVLRALRLAGLSVPDDGDIDRRDRNDRNDRSAKRQA